MTMASAQLCGEDFMVGLDRRRHDVAGQLLEPVPTPASTTWAGNAKRFRNDHLAGLPAAMNTINTGWVSRLPVTRRGTLLREVTIDGDATDVEVYGRTKQGAAHAYTGALTLRPHIAYWAEAGVPLAAELMGGIEDPRSNMVAVLDAAIAALPDGIQHISCRWDAGYFAADLATACLARGVSFAIGAKRTKPLMVAGQHAPQEAWVPAIGMEHTWNQPLMAPQRNRDQPGCHPPVAPCRTGWLRAPHLAQGGRPRPLLAVEPHPHSCP